MSHSILHQMARVTTLLRGTLLSAGLSLKYPVSIQLAPNDFDTLERAMKLDQESLFLSGFISDLLPDGVMAINGVHITREVVRR